MINIESLELLRSEDMNYDQYEPVIEAILFSLGRSVAVEKIASAIELDVKTTKKVIQQMIQRYQL